VYTVLVKLPRHVASMATGVAIVFVVMSSQRSRIQFTVGLLACFVLAYAAGFVAFYVWDDAGFLPAAGAGRSEALGVFWETWERLEKHFYGELPAPQARTYGAIRGALELLGDPYTVFVEPQPRALERDRLRGAFGGIGVDLQRDPQGVVLSPYPDSPAERAGVRDGDVLLAVDGETISAETPVDDARARLRGEAGTPVTITISRPPTPPLDLTIEREEIQVPSVAWRALDAAPDIGYVRVEAFTERTGQEVIAALQDLLQDEAISGLVLDLRGNSGGLIEPAVTTASQFLRDGVVLIELSRETEERSVPVRGGGIATDVPLAVLVDGGTASAAEIVAGALQDYGRAPLIGEPTFGKGAVQLIFDLSDGSSLHVTSAIWLTPNRNRIDGQGLTPDIDVPNGDGAEDEPLEHAVAYLRTQACVRPQMWAWR